MKFFESLKKKSSLLLIQFCLLLNATQAYGSLSPEPTTEGVAHLSPATSAAGTEGSTGGWRSIDLQTDKSEESDDDGDGPSLFDPTFAALGASAAKGAGAGDDGSDLPVESLIDPHSIEDLDQTETDRAEAMADINRLIPPALKELFSKKLAEKYVKSPKETDWNANVFYSGPGFLEWLLNVIFTVTHFDEIKGSTNNSSMTPATGVLGVSSRFIKLGKDIGFLLPFIKLMSDSLSNCQGWRSTLNGTSILIGLTSIANASLGIADSMMGLLGFPENSFVQAAGQVTTLGVFALKTMKGSVDLFDNLRRLVYNYTMIKKLKTLKLQDSPKWCTYDKAKQDALLKTQKDLILALTHYRLHTAINFTNNILNITSVLIGLDATTTQFLDLQKANLAYLTSAFGSIALGIGHQASFIATKKREVELLQKVSEELLTHVDFDNARNTFGPGSQMLQVILGDRYLTPATEEVIVPGIDEEAPEDAIEPAHPAHYELDEETLRAFYYYMNM